MRDTHTHTCMAPTPYDTASLCMRVTHKKRAAHDTPAHDTSTSTKAAAGNVCVCVCVCHIQCWEKAAELAINFQRHRMHDVVAVVSGKLQDVGRHQAAGELHEGIDDVQGAFDTHMHRHGRRHPRKHTLLFL